MPGKSRPAPPNYRLVSPVKERARAGVTEPVETLAVADAAQNFLRGSTEGEGGKNPRCPRLSLTIKEA